MAHKEEIVWDGQKVSIEMGKYAQQADGSAYVRVGNNIVLVTVVSSRRPSTMDFFPLTVEYAEKFYSTGKIPGGYFKREGRPSNFATLNARLIDRPIRPCFPDGYKFDTQIVATILSSDGTFPLPVMATLGASAAIHASDIPFSGPIATVQVSKIDGEWVINPSDEKAEKAELLFTVAGTEKGLLMVEGESKFVSESVALEALKKAHESILPVLELQNTLREKMGNKTKREFTPFVVDETRKEAWTKALIEPVKEAFKVPIKKDRNIAFSAVKADHLAMALEQNPDVDADLIKKEFAIVMDGAKYTVARKQTMETKKRIDGRDFKTIRPIACEVGMLPRAHGSGLFTRGETQVMGTLTLGTGDDEQFIETLSGTVKKPFLMHYNFPPYSVGETGRMGGQSRREIGHGFLAERAIKAVLPDHKDFPYTIRVVSEVLGCNGSSSMGTVCAGILGLLDAGVPIKGTVAGIAMGLMKEDGEYAVLSDILGDEDHLGDMDFKVTGTREGITALQMDIKIDSIPFEVMEQALSQAHEGRTHIIGEMEKAISTPRGELSEYAPRIQTIKIKPEKVRDIIGPGGKMIKSIIEQTGVKIDIEDSGNINIASTDPVMAKKAIDIIESICAEAEKGKTYSGKVVKIMEFGALVEVLPNTAGLLHISEIAHERVRNVTDHLAEGDQIDVKVIDVDRAGRIKLSRKALLKEVH